MSLILVRLQYVKSDSPGVFHVLIKHVPLTANSFNETYGGNR